MWLECVGSREPSIVETSEDCELDECDRGEPALGATTACNQDVAWSHGQMGEDEPSLGATNALDQSAWGEGGADERELVNEDGCCECAL